MSPLTLQGTNSKIRKYYHGLSENVNNKFKLNGALIVPFAIVLTELDPFSNNEKHKTFVLD